MSYKIVIFLVVVDIVIAISYLVSKDIARFFYWMSAGAISSSTLFMK